MTRLEKREKLEAVYAKALDVLEKHLGKDKDQVYAACQAMQTVSRELVVLERVIAMVGETPHKHAASSIGWAEIAATPDGDASPGDASA